MTENQIGAAEALARIAAWSKNSTAVSVVYGGFPSILTGLGNLMAVSPQGLKLSVKGKQTSFEGEREITAEITIDISEIVGASSSTVFDAPQHLQEKMAANFDEAVQINLSSGRMLMLYKPASVPQA